ncbi:hypothetical protein IRJ41_003596 [Triplophysa rosa]|uniref:Integrase catalytic domain-containing protein n=1 Tax=Triplophysa rosa TaxID=992332 RepID=A0A9W7T4N5_TRIRA|nr:hypothetical protein IRJ41_003596 [Triplophysa rosa]
MVGNVCPHKPQKKHSGLINHICLYVCMRTCLVCDLYADISDDDLDRIVADIQNLYPNSGYRMMHVDRVRESLRRVDPQGTQQRALSLRTLRRRQYSVIAPNAMWHIDGNHKLIMWRFVVHGGIDGFSRMIVYLKAATRNSASVVLLSFIEAVNRFGLPSRVRSDKGRENVDVAYFMVSNLGENRQSHITGRSVHNQRIERLWRDVYQHVLDLFSCLFLDLEAEGTLNPDNEKHLFSLYWSFLPQLQRHLEFFQEAWNNHKLRTAGNQSPLQLWTRFQDIQDPYQVDDDYGVDWEGPHSCEEEGVNIPEVQLTRELTNEEIAILPNPDVPFLHAVQIYHDTVNVINQLMS